MTTEFKPYPEYRPRDDRHHVFVLLQENSPLHDMLDKVKHTDYYEMVTWDGKFFIPDPFTGHCCKVDDNTNWGVDVSDQVDAFLELLEEE